MHLHPQDVRENRLTEKLVKFFRFSQMLLGLHDFLSPLWSHLESLIDNILPSYHTSNYLSYWIDFIISSSSRLVLGKKQTLGVIWENKESLPFVILFRLCEVAFNLHKHCILMHLGDMFLEGVKLA